MKIYRFIKRILEFILVFILVILLSPLFLIISFLIKIDSKGPVIYKQKRMLKPGQPFFIYKFRTMRANARLFQKRDGIMKKELVTRMGKYLREIHFDEFPQFFNILKGEMSFIGPRPQYYDQEVSWLKYDPQRAKRFQTRLGMVSIERLINLEPRFKDQIIRHLPQAKHLENEKRRVVFDYYYVDHESLYVDLVILYYYFKLLTTRIINVIFKGRFDQYEYLSKEEILK